MQTFLALLKRALRSLGPLVVAGIFACAIWLLYHQVRKYSLVEIRTSVEQIPMLHLLASVGLMIVNYAILVGYDWLAIKGIKKELSVPRVTLVSFVGQAVSYNFGALLGGTTVRYRFYTAWGFSPLDIVRLVLMLAVTFWVGALGLVGAIFMFAPPTIPPELSVHLPFDIHLLGALLFFIAISYLIVCRFVHKPIHIFGKEFAFPPFHIALAQALVAGADLVVAGACLYVLLPADVDVSFIQFLPSYLMGMVMVVLSHVPGGVGVLEVVIMHLTTADPKGVFAALICFRAIYYLIPLLAAAVLFAIYEIRYQAQQSTGSLRDVGRWIRAFAPTLMAYALFVCGAIVCIAVVIPGHQLRMEALRHLEPLVVLEIAQLLTAVAGVFMMILAPGLQHRKAAAFKLATLALAVAAVGALLSSMNWSVALLCLLVLCCICSIRGRCRRPSSLWTQPANLRWLLITLMVLVGSATFGLMLLRAAPSDPYLWFYAEYTADAPRLLRTLTTEALVLLALIVGYARTAPLRRRKRLRMFMMRGQK